MAKLTPIERAIAGQSPDRRRRYDQEMRKKGFVRATFMCRPEYAELIKSLAKRLRDEPDAIHELQALLDRIESHRGRTERPQRSEDAPRAPAPPRAHP